MALLAATIAYSALSLFATVRVTPSPVIFPAIAVVAVSEIIILFFIRRNFVLQSAVQLGTQPEDSKLLVRWRAGQIITWALSLSIALYGLVLRYMGFSFPQVLPFFVAGVILLLVTAPRRPQELR